MKLKQLLQFKREAIVGVGVRHGAFNMRVLGSVARCDGESAKSSDSRSMFGRGEIFS
jgi:hypothetical protein